jgi:hypothetical protein
LDLATLKKKRMKIIGLKTLIEYTKLKINKKKFAYNKLFIVYLQSQEQNMKQQSTFKKTPQHYCSIFSVLGGSKNRALVGVFFTNKKNKGK